MAMSLGLLVAIAAVAGLIPTPTSGADILLVPFAQGFNSRLVNMQKIADLLIDAGHTTSILISNIVEKSIINKRTSWHIYKVPDNATLQQTEDRGFLDMMMYERKKMGLWEMVQSLLDFAMPHCKALLGDRKMLPQLKAHNFDLLFIDIADDCSRIITDYLDIPTILYSNYGFNYDTSIFYPQPFTFVCTPELSEVCTSDNMNFRERLSNFISHVIMEFGTVPYLFQQYDELRKRFGYNVTLQTKDSFKRHVVIANTDFAIDFPRPLMPHVVTISGIFRKDPKLLSSDLEKFFASSGDNGVVVLSFGTLVHALDDAQTEIVARVFAKLPQKVLWRHAGTRPKNLGSNTMLMNWIPQNDILAHPKVVLYITHCGIASTFEAAIHGVPVVTVPLFLDQHYNSARLVKRAKMGVEIDFFTLTERKLAWAINHVINTTTYRDNAKTTAKLMNDAPNSPKDLLLYWIDYVIRHKGAHHLQSDPVRNMALIQYLGIDILAVLVGTLIAAITLITCCLYGVFKLTCGKLSSNQTKIKKN